MSVQACADLVAEGDPQRFRVVMTMPVEARLRLFPILAFNLEIARAPYLTAEPMIAKIRLQWWRDCLDEIFEDREVRKHEVSTALAEVVRNLQLERAAFDDVIDAREVDIEGFDFTSWDALWNYLDVSGGALLSLCADAVEVQGPARRIGTGYAAAGWLRAAPDLIARGGKVIPDEAGISDFVASAFDRMAGCAALQPVSRFGYLVPVTLKRARRSPKAVIAGGLDVSPLRAQAAFLRALF